MVVPSLLLSPLRPSFPPSLHSFLFLLHPLDHRTHVLQTHTAMSTSIFCLGLYALSCPAMASSTLRGPSTMSCRACYAPCHNYLLPGTLYQDVLPWYMMSVVSISNFRLSCQLGFTLWAPPHAFLHMVPMSLFSRNILYTTLMAWSNC